MVEHHKNVRRAADLSILKSVLSLYYGFSFSKYRTVFDHKSILNIETLFQELIDIFHIYDNHLKIK